MSARDEFLYMAKLAEQAERWDDMIEYMKRVVSLGLELSVSERDSLSAAYKNSVAARRKAWRIIYEFEQREYAKISTRGSDGYEAIAGYRGRVVVELQEKCNDILSQLETLIPAATSGEAKVFYLKMKGDYYRYSAEFSDGEARTRCSAAAKEAYEQATNIAKADLPAHSHVRLGLALNFSVFYYEVMDEKVEACRLAKSAFDEAVAAMADVPADQQEEEASSVNTLLQLLRDNIALWTADQTEDGRPPEQDGTAIQEL